MLKALNIFAEIFLAHVGQGSEWDYNPRFFTFSTNKLFLKK